MSIANINNALETMKAMESLAKGREANGLPVENGVQEFGKVLSNFVNEVNTVKIDSERLQDRFVKGDPSVTLPQVMIASEKASLQLSLLTEVRNKFVEAYSEISRMGV